MERDLEPLTVSIRSVGVITTPRFQSTNRGYRIISGFMRCQACRSLGIEHVDGEVSGSEVSDETLLLESLHENRFTRGFTWAERAWVLDRVVNSWGKSGQWAIEHVMPALELQQTTRSLQEHLKLSGVAESVQRALVNYGCSMANAQRLSSWPPEDQYALLSILEPLHLGENVLRECIVLLREICLRDGISLAAFLNEPECWEILNDSERDRPQRTRDFRFYLRRKRYPTLVAMEEAFREARRQLRFTPGLSVQHGEYFEEEGIRVSFRARNPEEFVQFCSGLWDASREREKIEALFRAEEEPLGSYQ
jgi:hypothetical protein